MKFLYFEEVLKLMFASNKNPSGFVDFFDNSSLLIGFNFCCQSKKFTDVSRSFRHILGYEIDNILNNNNFLDKIIHPHDRSDVQRYLFEKPVMNRTVTNGLEFPIPRIKCRGKHVRDYWKYLIFFSVNNWNENTKSNNKTGLIADEHIKPLLQLIPNGLGRSFKISRNPKETIKGNYSRRSKISVSHREIEILELVGNGMIAKEIADKLNISTSTVITHRKNLFSKFHARNTAELVKLTTQLMLV